MTPWNRDQLLEVEKGVHGKNYLEDGTLVSPFGMTGDSGHNGLAGELCAPITIPRTEIRRAEMHAVQSVKNRRQERLQELRLKEEQCEAVRSANRRHSHRQSEVGMRNG